MTALGLILWLAALALALHAGTGDDGGLRIFDGGMSFSLAIVGGSLVSS